MKKLVLHIGMGKTGTSSIQEALGLGSEQLAEQGVYYAPWRPFNHSFMFTPLFLRDPHKSFYYRQLSPISDEAWAKEVKRLKLLWHDFFTSFTQGTCIVSAENMGPLFADEISSLKDFVAPWFDEFRVVAYVRDPLQALKSKWEQNVKELNEPLAGNALLAKTKRQMTYRFFERWIEAFGQDNFRLRRFEPSRFVGGNLLTDFLYAGSITLQTDLSVPELESNQSLGEEGTALLLAMNARYPWYTDAGYNQDRGMARKQHLFYKLMRESGAGPLCVNFLFDESEAQNFNLEIHFLNSLLPDRDRFDDVAASTELTELPDSSAISAEYVIELINGLSRLVDDMADRNQYLESINVELLERLKK